MTSFCRLSLPAAPLARQRRGLLLTIGLLVGCGAPQSAHETADRQPTDPPPLASTTTGRPPARGPVASVIAGASPASSRAPAAAPAFATTSFLAVGDILLSRGVAACIADHGDPNAPFRHVAPLLASADFSFGNLESPFSASDQFSVSSANIFNTPRAHVRGLVDHRFRIVSLANNHVLDQGVAGLRTTLRHLADHGVATVGAGLDADAAWQPAVVESRGIRIGFVGASYASVNDSGTLRSPYVARLDDRDRLGPAIEKARASADVVVVTMHAGREYNPHVHPSQTVFAHAAIDLGADVVFGAHPHVLQRVERYRDRYIFYSLGNFIFDHVRPGTRQGLAVRSRIRASAAPSSVRRAAAIERFELQAVVIEDRCAPRPASESETENILASVGLSEAVLTM